MWSIIIFTICIAYGAPHFLAPKAGCSIDTNNVFPSPDPLLLNPDTTYDQAIEYKKGFIVPDKNSGLITLAAGEKVRFACIGHKLIITGSSEETATCAGNNDFKLTDGTVVSIDELSCDSFPVDTALRRGSCIKGGTRVDLGFNSDTFYPLIYVCFNEKTLETYYSQEIVPAELAGRQTGQERPSFKRDDFYDFDVDDAYTYKSQLKAFETLLGSAQLAEKYVSDQTSHYLARGHFAPQADFIYRSAQRATFHFVNVAPQWQLFNGGVWSNLESEVRDYAISSGIDLIAYTGPLGALTYPDINNNPIEIFLAFPGTSEQSIKVPKFYWKVIVDSTSKKGVAFVGINNLLVDQPWPKDYVLCDNVFDKLSWISIKDTSLLYACEVSDFAENSDTFPNFGASGLLDK